MSGLAPENVLAQDFQASFPSASGSSRSVGSGPPAEHQNSSRAESNCDIGNQDPSGLPLPRWSCCGPGAWPVRPAPRTRTREAKRAGRKTRTGAKRATSVFTLFRHPSSAATPGATSPVPPIAPASRWWVVQSPGEHSWAQGRRFSKDENLTMSGMSSRLLLGRRPGHKEAGRSCCFLRLAV